MRFHQRIMPKNEADLVGESIEQQFRGLHGHFAARTLEIAVFEQGDACVLRAARVIHGVRRHRQGNRVR